MGKCMHVVPGRARFTVPEIRQSLTVARALARGLRGMEGVDSVLIRQRSASLIVHYDPRRIEFDALCAYVTGLTAAPPPPPRRAAPHATDRHGVGRRTLAVPLPLVSGTARHLGKVISRTAFSVMLEKAVHRGVQSLLQAAPR